MSAAPGTDQADRRRAAEAAVAANPVWYHTIELAPGVLTPGRVDLRRTAQRVLPDDLDGLRALDVGTFDGFWAFELERRGARVVAVDTDRIEENEWPPIARDFLEREHARFGVELGLGFRLAAEQLGSSVLRQPLNVYELSPERVNGGAVDLVFIGALLLHLRDPVRALEAVHRTLRPGGRLTLVEPVSLAATLLAPRRAVAQFRADRSRSMTWWYPNLRALIAWLVAAGFQEVRRGGFHRPPAFRWMRQSYCSLTARKPG